MFQNKNTVKYCLTSEFFETRLKNGVTSKTRIDTSPSSFLKYFISKGVYVPTGLLYKMNVTPS